MRHNVISLGLKYLSKIPLYCILKAYLDSLYDTKSCTVFVGCFGCGAMVVFVEEVEDSIIISFEDLPSLTLFDSLPHCFTSVFIQLWHQFLDTHTQTRAYMQCNHFLYFKKYIYENRWTA